MTPSLKDFEKKTGYCFSDFSLLNRALTHRSLANTEGNNERLEFIGDAVLDLIIAETLYHKYADLSEGRLDPMRASLVNGKALTEHAKALGIDKYLQVSEAQRQHNPLPSAAMLEDALEALTGAIYLDGGIEAARTFVLKVFETEIDTVEKKLDYRNPKGRLQELLQKQHLGLTPEYTVLTAEGPGHARCFETAVHLGSKELARGWGRSKKAAEIAAAEQALKTLEY